ncbi:transglutaminase domain-containing protein [Desulfocurvus sp. DL9XJH121]
MTRRHPLKSLFITLLLLVVTAAAAGSAYIYATYGDAIRDFIKRQEKAAQYQRIGFFDQKDQRLIDYIRSLNVPRRDLPAFCNNLIFDNSNKGYVDEYNRKVKRIMGMLVEHIEDPAKPKPETKCDSRALVLGALLKAFGIESRIVHGMGYDKPANEFIGHTFLEVKEADGWAIYDPYFGTSYKRDAHGPVSLMRALLCDAEDLVPVSSLGEGWAPIAQRTDPDQFNRLYSVAIYDNRANGEKSTVIVNTAKVRRMTGGKVQDGLDKALRDYITRKWFDPVIIML